MPSRLNRVLLVNTRTSGHLTSGAINELNPQGGAAVTGENSVGKTTTQQIFALFLGSRPSQIVEAGSGNLPQLKFVLPTPQSAIVFEYQRGDGEDRTRCVVIRRDPNGDAADYRLFKGPFREELFIAESTDGKRVFVDDAGFMEQARKHGVSPERILSTPEYCSVILGYPANTKKGASLRVMSMEYSYGRKSLQHLDRLVAAMVKERIDFRDFINVALSIVEESIGRKTNGRHNTIHKLPQGKKQIALWLENVDGCRNAIKQEGQVEQLRTMANTYGHHESQLRNFRADVQHLLGVNEKKTTNAKRALSALKKDREAAVNSEASTLGQLEQSASTKRQEKNAAVIKLQEQESTRQSFLDMPITQVIKNVDSLPTLYSELSTLKGQIEGAEGQVGNITSHYDGLISKAEDDCRVDVANLKESIPTVLQSHSTEAERIRTAQTGALNDHDARTDAILSELSEQEGLTRDAMTTAQLNSENIHPSAESRSALEDANQKLDDHRVQAASDQADYTLSIQLVHEAQKAYDKADAVVRSRLQDRDVAIKALEAAQKNLTPDDGTLLAALRSSTDQKWKANIARVVDPALLHRTDLSPIQGETHNDLYGWSVVTENIDPPVWAVDESMRAAIKACEFNAKAADTSLKDARATLKTAFDALEDAQSHKSRLESKTTVNKEKTPRLIEAVEIAKGRIEKERVKQKSQAEADLAAAKIAYELAVQATKSAKTSGEEAREKIEKAFKKQLGDCDTRKKAAEDSIDGQIASRQEALKKTTESIKYQRDRHLRNEGVDAELVSSLTTRREEVKSDIQTFETQRLAIERWNEWNEKVGPIGIAALKRAAESAVLDSQVADQKLSAHRAAMSNSLRDFERTAESLAAQVESLEQDERTLKNLDERLSQYHPAQTSFIDSESKPSELKSHVLDLMETIESLETQISKLTRTLRESLTGKTNTIQKQIQSELAETGDSSVVKRALDLCQAHNRSIRDTIAAVQSETQTILGGIMQYKKDISLFKSEVDAFDRKLSQGLQNVTTFKRVKELQIHFTADFESLDFIKKLDVIEEVSKVQRQEAATWGSKDLPNKGTVDALRDFMSLLSVDGTLEVDYARQITIRGSVEINGVLKEFKRETELAKISSTGLNAIIFITLLSGMANIIRGEEQIYIPWVTDEIGKFDPGNFHNLMQMLRDNHIDVVTASPALTIAEFRHFARCYRFGDRGSIAKHSPTARQKVAA